MKINGAELLVRCLVANGITEAFNVPGFGLHSLADALKRHRGAINYYSAPSETAVGLMADGYGRATGRPAFVNVYHASGTALAMMGITTAWADRSPMLFTTTTSSTKFERRDQYASVPRDITEMTRQFTKWDWEVPSAERIPEAIARAVILAKTPPRGPVHLAFPMDIYDQEVDDTILQHTLMARPDRLNFYDATVADPAGIEAAACLLASAERPLIVAGGDVTQYDAVSELKAIAEIVDAAVFGEPYVAYMGFPNTDPRFMGRFSPKSDLVKQADVALVVGAEFTAGGQPAVLPSGELKVIHLATDVREIGKQIWADVGLVGNPKPTLRALSEALAGKRRASRADWSNTCRACSQTYRSGLAEVAQRGWDGSPITIPRLLDEIGKAFGPEAIIVDHSTTGTAYVLEMHEMADTKRYFGISARASAQGWGVPASIGVQIGSPGRRVITLVGDGGFMFTGTALYAASRWNTRNVIIVLNNGGWHDVAYGAKKNRQWTDADIESFGWMCDPPVGFTEFARSLGVTAFRAETPEQLAAALNAAQDADHPIFVEVMSDPGSTEYYLSFIGR